MAVLLLASAVAVPVLVSRPKKSAAAEPDELCEADRMSLPVAS